MNTVQGFNFEGYHRGSYHTSGYTEIKIKTNEIKICAIFAEPKPECNLTVYIPRDIKMKGTELVVRGM